MISVTGDMKPFERKIDQLAAAAKRVSGDVATGYTEAFNKKVEAARRWVTEEFYPPEPRRPLDRRYTWRDGSTGHKFKTLKAQRYFFWALRTGKIRVPYKRTYKLQQAVEATIISATEKVAIIAISINPSIAPYAQYVVGDRQYYYHQKTGWPVLSRALERGKRSVLTVANEIGKATLQEAADKPV